MLMVSEFGILDLNFDLYMNDSQGCYSALG